MLPFHLTLAQLESLSRNTAFTPSMLSSPKPSWHRMWHGLKAEALNLEHQPSHQHLEMRQECRTFKSEGNGPKCTLASPPIFLSKVTSMGDVSLRVWLQLWMKPSRSRKYEELHIIWPSEELLMGGFSINQASEFNLFHGQFRNNIQQKVDEKYVTRAMLRWNFFCK